MRVWIILVLLGLAALPTSARAQYSGYYPPGYYYPQALPYAMNPYGQPAYAKPMYAPPAYAPPAYAPPTYSQPVYPQPAYPQPAYAPPTYSQPAYSQPVYMSPNQPSFFDAPQTRRPAPPAVVKTQAAGIPAAKSSTLLELPSKKPTPSEASAAKPSLPVELPTPPVKGATTEKTSDLVITPPATGGSTVPLIAPMPTAAKEKDETPARKPVTASLFPVDTQEPIPAPSHVAPPCGNVIEACEAKKCRFVVFGDYLYWTVHGVDVPYAQAFDGILPGLSAPRGPVAVVSPQFNSGFRIGGGALFHDGNAGLYGTFTYFRTNRSSDVTASDPFVLHNFLAFPNTFSSAVDSRTAHVDYRILLMMADIDYKCAIVNNGHLYLNWLAGVRYAHVEQNLDATYQITGTTTVNNAIDFDGFGPRVGLDGQYHVGGGVYGYAQGIFNLLFGQFRANSIEQNVFTGLVGQTGITANRAVPILEMEVGLGWQSPSGAFRIQGGYYVGAWFNTITMTSLSQGITATNFTTNSNNFRDSMIFDGLVLRGEIRY